MSNRFHNKFHRHNHHTSVGSHTSEPDAIHDPIASYSDPFQGDFIIASPGLLSARDIRTNTIQPYSGTWITIPANVFITNLSSLSATVNYQDILVSEISGFWAKGSDSSLTIPNIVSPGVDNMTLDKLGVSSNSWGTFDGDLQTRRNLYVSGVASINDLTIAGCLSTDCIKSTTSISTGINIWNNLDMHGYSVLNIGNSSLGFQSGAKIQSDSTQRILLSSYSYAESITTGTSAFGQYSHAEGFNNEAIGRGSHVEGNGNQVIGQYSHAEGFANYIDDDYSHAEGLGNYIYLDYAHAEGLNNTVSGQGSHVEGISNIIASGANYSHAEGQGNYIAASNSHIEGVFNRSAGSGSHAEGGYTFSSWFYTHTEGWYTSATDIAAHAEGYDTFASGIYSHAEGYSTIASNSATHTEGYSTSASGYYSHAEGARSVASGEISHAEGNATHATGPYAHTEGGFTSAVGLGAHAEGNATYASEAAAHAEGGFTIASGQESHAEGLYTVCTGQAAHTEGWYTSAFAAGSHAEGGETIALAAYSHAEGSASIASGLGAHAEGFYTVASGDYTHAAGSKAMAIHDRTWIWSSNSIPVSTSTTDQFVVCAISGVFLGNDTTINGTLNFNNSTLIDSTVTSLTGSNYFLTCTVNGSSMALPLFYY